MKPIDALSERIIKDIKTNPKTKNVYKKFNNFTKLVKSLNIKKTVEGELYNNSEIDVQYVTNWLNSNFIPKLSSGIKKS